LGEELAKRNHEVHFISYGRPFRLPRHASRIHFHSVSVNDYGLFKYPDYTLPLSVKMAEVSRDHRLDVLHVHYAVPHATAAILARSMLPPNRQPRLVTTLHGTDTSLLGLDPGYGPAIRYALGGSDAITTVSHSLREQTQKLLRLKQPIEVIHNFFEPRLPKRSVEAVREELGLKDEIVVLHASNLRPLKRIDLLLKTMARVRPRSRVRLVILAGASFKPFAHEACELGLEDRMIVLDQVKHIEDYLQIADLGLYTSDSESFCLSILEAMCFGCPSVATRVGGIPEVVEHNVNGILVPAGSDEALAEGIESLVKNPERRRALGRAAQSRSRAFFSADVIVPQYEELYRRVCRAAKKH
jgi:N-acetyl-alpha-D-glucosaminyl L-malate synthase BshA